MVIATCSTYGLYILASMIHMDPWHLITSMPQYLILLPTYTNIFMIYSFCNLHDVSWGTKGDNVVAADSAPATAKKGADGEQVFTVSLPDDDEECSVIFNSFKKQMVINKNNPFVDKSKPNLATVKEDNCKEFRTSVILSWMFCNAILVRAYNTRLLFSRTRQR